MNHTRRAEPRCRPCYHAELRKGIAVIYGGFGDEWAEWHLTPRGWLRGTRYIGGRPGTNTLRPPDWVMTCRYHELLTAERFTTFIETAWLGTDADAIATLLAQYGPCPEKL